MGAPGTTKGRWWIDASDRRALDHRVSASNGMVAIVGNGFNIEAARKDAAQIAASGALYDALTDMLAGWRYIRQVHGDLSGVGWDRAEDAATKALRLARGGKVS